jgi:hypothetical protein
MFYLVPFYLLQSTLSYRQIRIWQIYKAAAEKEERGGGGSKRASFANFNSVSYAALFALLSKLKDFSFSFVPLQGPTKSRNGCTKDKHIRQQCWRQQQALLYSPANGSFCLRREVVDITGLGITMQALILEIMLLIV